jgi:hypothetical protein
MPQEFSPSDFEAATGVAYPPSARVIQGESLGWDIHGDHDACALIEVSPEDHQRLLLAMGQRAESVPPASLDCSEHMNAEIKKVVVRASASKSAEGGYSHYWALAKDKPLVVVQYSSW